MDLEYDILSNKRSFDNSSISTTGKEPFHFIITDITEAFIAAIELSIFISIYMTIPLFFYQFWLFIKPGLYEYEKKAFKRYYLMYCLLSILNIIITYWILLPATCNLFLSFEMSNIKESSPTGVIEN
jgi:sec-independent protein translocase protein TatC